MVGRRVWVVNGRGTTDLSGRKILGPDNPF